MNRYQQKRQALVANGLERRLCETEALDGTACLFDGQPLQNFSSNDYLGLSADPTFKAAFLSQLNPKSYSFSSTSSRLLTGNNPHYTRLEKAIAQWFGQAANTPLFFNSGYHANVGILPAISEKKDLIVADKQVHASIIDGIRLSRAKYLRFRHNDMAHLQKILHDNRHLHENVFIVTESLFSMDGDLADISRLVALKKRYDALLYLDEAHAVGAVGKDGHGLSARATQCEDIDILVCPAGKAMSGIGAFVMIKPILRDTLINRARTLIYSTALAPINLAWMHFVVKQMPQLHAQREKLQKLCHTANQSLQEYGLATSQSHIVPVLVGDNQTAVDLANHLRTQGYLVFPIRPPTVAKNTARIRLSLTANMHPNDVASCIAHIGRFLKQR